MYGCAAAEGVKNERPTVVECDAVAASSASLGASSQSRPLESMNRRVRQSAAESPELHYSTATAENTMV